ncbi:MAG: DUF5615 family PIN-like protein [Candidatus Acidiferrales bacterium]
MNIKLDENLPLRLATRLKGVGHDVQTVHDERLVGHSDSEIWQAVQNESRFLITQDLVGRVVEIFQKERRRGYSRRFR